MTDEIKNQLIKQGLILLDAALQQFTQIEGCDDSSTMAKIIHNSIMLAEISYGIKK